MSMATIALPQVNFKVRKDPDQEIFPVRLEREKVFNVGLRLKKFHYNKITSFGRYPERYNDNAKKVNEGRSWNQD